MARVDSRYLRILDANFNRGREGLRVCEDVCRFLLSEGPATRQYKKLRHELSAALQELGNQGIIGARDIEGDVGRKSTRSEFQRRSVKDIFYANSQRAKESIRVLEEFTKLVNPKVAERLKKLRYAIYRLERQVVVRF